MPQLQPSWQLSLTTATVLVAVAVACGLGPLARHRRMRLVSLFARQFAIVMALLALWQRVGALVHTRVDGALERGRAVYHLQRALHLPDEVTLQHLVLPHPDLVRAANLYYEYAHLNGMALFLVWLWWRHREYFTRVRTVVVLVTLASLLIQIVPVAPPRLLPEFGFVDTALRYGQSVYGDFATGLANQLSAMPSVHVAWALIVGVYVWRAGTGRWRVVGPVHTVVTVLVVVVTANHWWMDGIVAAGLFALAVPLTTLLHALARHTRTALLHHGSQLPAYSVPGSVEQEHESAAL